MDRLDAADLARARRLEQAAAGTVEAAARAEAVGEDELGGASPGGGGARAPHSGAAGVGAEAGGGQLFPSFRDFRDTISLEFGAAVREVLVSFWARCFGFAQVQF